MRKRLRESIAGILALLMVLGSFQITGLQVNAEGTGDVADNSVSSNDVVIYALNEEDRNITENVLSSYNTSFEGVNDKGDLYWWNDANWSQVNIPRQAHGENKPSTDCGDYYVEVRPASDGAKAVCQVGDTAMAGLIKGGVTYEYSYYAKLTSGSGSVNMSVVGEMSDWSSQSVATVSPDKAVTLTSDSWTKVTGTFVLPDSKENVKIVFEGSEGLTYCLDDVRVAEVPSEETPDRNITENVLNTYNTSFEGVDGNGNLYWWNDANWSQVNIPRQAHGENKPSTDCGDYYVEVRPASDGAKAVCQVGDTAMAGLIKSGVTYEYSYYAKLTSGSGSVNMSVVGEMSDWSSQSVATVSPDKAVTLTADSWTKVTGTFVLPDSKENVKIVFEGSEGLTYCLDDFRVGKLAGTNEEEPNENLGDNIIDNGNFADADLSMWSAAQGDSEITQGVSETPIFDDVKTYGIISGRTANWQSFAQDITGEVESGKEYQFSFYAKLSDDYANAPSSQREITFGPYEVVGGEENYNISVTGSPKTITVGEWTKIAGTFTLASLSEPEKVVVRLLEQGENYGGGPSVMGEYYITGVSVKEIVKEKPEIEQDILDWKDAIIRDLGAGTIAGTAVTESEMNDATLMELVNKHFNAVTLGNELKPDALFGYSNTQCSGTEQVDLNGETITVPVLDFSRADRMLNKILTWNNENPDNALKVRGHVLVWHSQTPEWFFHENYDASAPYVSSEEMNKRLEWFIKTVFEHYLGADSPYKDLFYGWDVVNEAISDSTGTYRTNTESTAENEFENGTHKSNSSWWAVYNGNEFIIKAFQYANKYAPSTLELYYNDYGDCKPAKVKGIVQLLTDVLAAGGTRIDAMGMQAHYSINETYDYGPSFEELEAAVRAYCAVSGIDKVQLTELDIKASSSYDGTDATREEEYNKMAYRYKDYYDVLKKLDAEDGIDVDGITIWGVIDKYSWLHQQAGVGGGADGKQKQCPLLFDDNYKAKPSFWAFVDSSKLSPRIPEIQKIVISPYEDGNYSQGMEYSISQGNTTATFVPMWDENGLQVLVTVQDATVDATDAVTVYVDPAMTAGETTPKSVTVNRANAQTIDGGYSAEVSVELSSTGIAKKVSMDVVVVNGAESMAFNDTSLTQETSSKYYATATMKPIVVINQGTITIDGEVDDKWAEVEEIPLTINLGAKVESNIKMLWDEDYLYILAEVTDAELNKDNTSEWLQDSIEVFIDENNKKTSAYDADDKQYRINYINDQSFGSQKWDAGDVKSVAKTTADGYVIEAAFKWTDITPEDGTKIGLELQINDAAADAAEGEPGRLGTLSWADDTGMGYAGSDVFGTAVLVADEPDSEPEPEPEVPPSPEPTVTPSPEPTVTPSPEPEVTPSPDEVLKEMVEELSVLVDDKATKEEKIQAVKDIIAEVKELVENGNLDEVLDANVEYMEELFEKSIGRVLEVVNKDNKVPQIKKVIGALIGIDLNKEAKIVFEAVTAPSLEPEYKNAFAFDAKLFAGEQKTQPLVPVTIRMSVPSSIDKNGKVVVLHYADGATKPEKLAAKIVGDMLEFTTTHFSTFVVANEVEEQAPVENGSNDAGNNQSAPTPAPAVTEAPVANTENPAPDTGDDAYPMAAVAAMLLAGVSAALIISRKKKEEE